MKENGTNRGENSPTWKGRASVDCANCGVSKDVYPSRLETKSRHFCNLECYAEWQSRNRHGANHHQWKPGQEKRLYTGTWSRTRKRVRQRDGNRCQLCELSAEELGRIPDVHHIVPARSFDTPSKAHTMENLVQLCRLCHTMMERLPEEQQRALLEGRIPIIGEDIGRRILGKG